MRRKFIALYVAVIFIMIFSIEVVPVSTSKDLFHYYINNFYQDTGASNAVTAIYLNYRLFDTFFETLLLLVSVIGIIYFSRHEGDY
jgi:multicomponent Na+:H+ antiporter subunit B